MSKKRLLPSPQTAHRAWERRVAGALALACTVLGSVWLGSCGQVEEAKARDSASVPADWPSVIRFGLVPAEGGSDTLERFTPLLEYVEHAIGVPIEASSATEYVGVITAMQNDQVEFAYYGPKSYIEAVRRADAEAIVKEVNTHGVSGYHSILVARRDSGMRTLGDARGRDLALVTPNSTSGYLVPIVGIYDETGMLPEEYFGRIQFAGTHGNAVQSVIRGDVPVAATNDFDLEAMVRSGNADDSLLVELWRSELIPGSVIAARSELPESLKTAVRDAVIGFARDNRRELAEMSRGGFVEATDSDYDVTRLLEQRREELVSGGDG